MKKALISILFFSLVLASPIYAVTLTNGEWSTTFNCSDWTYYPSGGNPNTGCDGLTRSNDGSDSLYIRINSADNNPTGGGGKGLGWQVNDRSGQGTSPTGSNLLITLPHLTHFWIRWYLSLPVGMPIQSCTLNYWKLLYIYGGGNSFYVDCDSSGNDIRLVRSTILKSNYGFNDIFGSTSDGSWAAIEMEFDISGGMWRMWVYKNNVDDPTPKFQGSYSYPIPNVGSIKFPENLKCSCIHQYLSTPVEFKFDDIAVSTSGRIGTRILVGGGGGAGEGGGGGDSGGCFIDTVRHGTQTSGGKWLVLGLIAGGFASLLSRRIEN